MAERCNAWLQLDTANPESLFRRLKGVGVIEPPTGAEARDAAIVLLGLAIGAGVPGDARDVLDECGLLEARDG